ncbi:unnamed protein product [Ilex paraguariensis]|uniref:Uncharacterized protein n=1 Tax=Ilex paraguariensis TaxID=185542 RepID=A0ABC8QU72_9AQUA
MTKVELKVSTTEAKLLELEKNCATLTTKVEDQTLTLTKIVQRENSIHIQVFNLTEVKAFSDDLGKSFKKGWDEARQSVGVNVESVLFVHYLSPLFLFILETLYFLISRLVNKTLHQLGSLGNLRIYSAIMTMARMERAIWRQGDVEVLRMATTKKVVPRIETFVTLVKMFSLTLTFNS